MALTSVRTRGVIDVGEAARSTPASSSPHRGVLENAASALQQEMGSASNKSSTAPITNTKPSTTRPGANPTDPRAKSQVTAPDASQQAQSDAAPSMLRTQDRHPAPPRPASHAVGRASNNTERSVVAAVRPQREGTAKFTQTGAQSCQRETNPSAARSSRNTPNPSAEPLPLNKRNKNFETPAPAPSHTKHSDRRPTTGKLRSRKQLVLAQVPVHRPVAGENYKGVPDPTSTAIREDYAAQTTSKAKIPTARPSTVRKTRQIPLAALDSAAQRLVHPSSPRRIHESKSKRDQDAVEVANEVPANLGDGSEAQDPSLGLPKPARGTSKRRAAPGDVVGSSKRSRTDLAPPPTDEPRPTNCSRVQDELAPTSASRKARKAQSSSKKPQIAHAHEMGTPRAPKERGMEGAAFVTEALTLRRSARNAAKARQNASHDSSHITANTATETRGEKRSWDGVQATVSDESIIAVTHKRITNEEAREMVPPNATERLLTHKNAPLIENPIAHEKHEVTATPAVRSGFIIPSTLPQAAQMQNPAERKSYVVPGTPAPLPSSPPQRSLVRNGPSRSTIISFDRTGPRNQGSGLGKTKETDLACAGRGQSPSSQRAAFPHAQLRELDGHGPSSVATCRTAKTGHSTRPSPRNVASCVRVALADFLTGQKTSVPTPTKHAQSKAGKAANKASSPAKEDDEGFQCIDDFEGSTLVEQPPSSSKNVTSKAEVDRTASHILMPPPAPRAEVISLHKSPNAPVPVSKEKVRTGKRSLDVGAGKVASPIAGEKRANQLMHEDALPPKRSKMTTVVDDGFANVTVNTNAESPVPAIKQPVRKPTKRVTRRVNRRSTKGTVDLGGSPVPKNYEYGDGFGTVLEQFSAHAKLSSDHCHESSSARVVPVARQLSQAELSQGEFPPSHQPHARSSNSKHKPASPERDSQAVTDFAVQLVSPGQLMVRDAGAAPAEDPFKNLGGEVKTKVARHRVSRQGSVQMRAYVPCAENLSEASQHGALEHDPEETLVEPENAQRRIPNVWNNKSPASGVPKLPSSLDEIGAWRDGLSSHHMNLFDELVAVTHRLVQHLGDREMAARDVVEDYRRRGLRLVQQMEMNHAKDFAEYSSDFHQRRQMLRDELGEYSGQLAGSMEVLRCAKQQRIERARGRAEGDKRLSELIAKFQ